MVSKEDYIKEKEAGELSLEFIYEYYKEHRNPSKKELDFGEFSLAFQEWLRFPISNSSTGPKKVNKYDVIEKVRAFFDEKYGQKSNTNDSESNRNTSATS